MFISPAFAQAGGSGGSGDLIMQLLPFLLIFVIIYFLILRPQQKRARLHREMVAGVRRGDTLVTTGGLIGKVAKVVDDHEVLLEVAVGTKVRIVRSMIQEVRTKGEPAKETKAAKPARKVSAKKSKKA
ncbi:MAG: preprotein translocase subunit YajC [Alphaproteobacteria bacterium]